MPAPSETLTPSDSLFPSGLGGTQSSGSGIASGAPSGTSAVVYTESGGAAAGFLAASSHEFVPGVTAGAYPTAIYQVSFGSQPITFLPTWSELNSRVRGLSIRRGRSYEYERMETGTAGASLNNRDAALSPANTSSPYAPIKSTRPVRILLHWGTTYPIFRGISEGFPQSFPGMGKDAVVRLNASDFFYALNNARFVPGSTGLSVAMALVPSGTVEDITVRTTALPMPQVTPFELTIGEGLTSEVVTVTSILSATQYRVTRDAEQTWEHATGAPVSASAVSFAEELSGTRIGHVLEALGFDASVWCDLDAGQSVMAASEDLASVNPLEHINLVTEAEFGRFFVSREGKFTFRDRHSVYLDFLSPVVTFRDLPVSGSEIPYRIDGVLEHAEDKLFNRVKITIPSGEIVDVADEDSIDDHFERVFERSWPYANPNDAESAAHYILGRSVEHTLRVPTLTVFPVSSPSILWPLVLAREIGERVRFRYQPEGGGTEIDQEMIVEGIGHEIAPRSHAVNFQLTQADPNDYWILGTTGYSELGQTTWVGF